MPWDETNCMNERLRFIAARLEAGEPFSALCERFGVSRKTGYKRAERYELDGVAGLEDRSRPFVASSRCRGRRGGKDSESPEETPALGTAQVACHPRAALSAASAAGGEHDRRGSA